MTAWLPASDWKQAVIDTPQRCHQHIRYPDETVYLRDYEGPVRQIAATGLGHDQPTLVLSTDFEETPRALIIGDVGRNRVEGGLGISVNFFHLACLASEVRLNVDLEAALTVLANGCDRRLGLRLGGFEKAAPKHLYRRLVATGGTVDPGGSDDGQLGASQPEPDPSRSGLGPPADRCPLAGRSEIRVHLPLNRTTVKWLTFSPAAQIGA